MTQAVKDGGRTGDSRARELFHYFQPNNPAMLPKTGSAASKLKFSSSTTKPESPNLVLTALAQLAVVKVNAQRAIISVIDRETLYVVAEASRTLDLGKNDLHEDYGDGLWVGCSNGPLSGTLCEETIALSSSPAEPHPFFTVNDLREHPIYHKIPCVAGQPHFRFYSGTPLRSKNGVNIGTLYVMDPQPDLPLNCSHRKILGNVADAVMEYMETSRRSLEADRLTSLLTGLSTFVQGENGSDDWALPASLDAGIQAECRSQASASGSASPEDGHTDCDRPTSSAYADTKPQRSSDFASISSTQGGRREGSGLSYNHRPQTEVLCQRAANMMLKSLDLGSHGGVVIVGASHYDGGEDSEEACQGHESARVWACSQLEPEQREVRDGQNLSISDHMDSRFVRRMIKCHPKGGLWYFQDDTTLSSSDEDASGAETSKSSSYQSNSNVSPSSQSMHLLRQKDLDALKNIFPTASRVIFCPLWDSVASRWFGACFCWSRAETRVFSAEVDLGGLLGFGSSLMIEYSRILSQQSSIKKDDFISTISHELRSPLHGILGASEFLSDHIKSEFGIKLIDTIRACGQTLLDTFEQILDFTKINTFEGKTRSRRSPLRLGYRSPERNNKSYQSQSSRLRKLINVVDVVEDTVESVYAGHLMSSTLARGSTWILDKEASITSDSEPSKQDRVDVVFDVDPRDWLFVCEPGALRRIVMNVFGNALKYTPSGSITIHIGISEPPKTSPVLILAISDTGKGISPEYLHSHIFTPFSQEDSLSPGAGLGLSLVRKIIRSLNGTISVKSQKGSGTTVTMKFPLSIPQCTDLREFNPATHSPSTSQSDLLGLVREKLQGKSVNSIPSRDSRSASVRMIGRYLIEWLGMRPNVDSATEPFNVVITDEDDLDNLDHSHCQSLFLVLCRRGSRPWQQVNCKTNQLANIVWLIVPCGTQQLIKALHSHLQTYGMADGYNSSIKIMSESTVNQRESRNCTPSFCPSSQQGSTHTNRVSLESSSSSVPSDLSHSIENDSILTKLDVNKTAPFKCVGKGPRVLLVEDNAINLAILRKFVSRLEPEILHAATNGAKAVELVQGMAEGYQYILMDLSMPVMDGFEASRRIRSIEQEQRERCPAKIIALTGLGSSEHIKQAYEAGVNIFRRKPFSFNDIKELFENDTVT